MSTSPRRRALCRRPLPEEASLTRTHRFESFDGTELAWHEVGEGRPLLLLHGLFSSAEVNWIKFGTAARLAGAGYRCLMLDFRVHGDSAAPEDEAAYPKGVLEADLAAWTEHLGIADYDLAGFSLGARTAAIGVLDGLSPRRLALCGMGLEGICDHDRGTSIGEYVGIIDTFGTHRPGSEEYFTQQFLKTNSVNLIAARHLLHTLRDADRAALGDMNIPAAVICGEEDKYLADAKALAAHLPDAAFTEIAGTHMSSVTKPDLGEALAAFLGSPPSA